MTDNTFLIQHLSKYREQLRGKRIFLTGGTGFFGKWFQRSFLALGFEAELVVLSRDPLRFQQAFPEFCSSRITYIKGDIRNFQFPQGQFDYVIHAATEASAKLLAENPQEMYDVCVSGTHHALDFARQAQCKRFLFTSSGAVYGNQPPDLPGFPEDYPCHPVTAYGQGKYDAEQLCLQSGLDVVLPRCFAFVGPYLNLDIHFAVGNFIRDGLNGGPIVIKGDGRPYRSYLYAADLMVWLWTILLNGHPGRAYNVGSTETMSIVQIAKEVALCCSPVPEIKIQGIPDLTQPAPRYIPDITRVQDELDLNIQINLKCSIQKTLKSYIRNI